MLSQIHDTVTQLIPLRHRTTINGWTSFNAVCCHHRGHKPDTRGRGGLIINSDGTISYHCFNCNYKASYRPGLSLNYRFRNLLTYFNADDATINQLVIESLRLKNLIEIDRLHIEKVEIGFSSRSLPSDVELVETDPMALDYCQKRTIDLNRYPLLVSKTTDHNLNRRVIVPFTWNGQLIGYTSRAWDPLVKPKYYSNHDSNYVYNIDRQIKQAEFVVVVEGVFDAISIDGVAILGNECNEVQADIIDSLGREIILVPDRDRAGSKLIDSALNYGWSVSFPIWYETCKDVNEAVVKYGKLFVLKTIIDSKETGRLKIELKRKRLYN